MKKFNLMLIAAMALFCTCPRSVAEEDIMQVAEKLVKMEVTPSFNFKFNIMKPGVIQHLDRHYTYDVVPEELVGGLLFQGIHRPPKDTIVKFTLLSPATVYFFFHHSADGGYTEIFKDLKDWKRCAVFPQYDIKSESKHGMNMLMYQLEADAGTYVIPPTTKDKACFNIVFQAKKK